MQQWASEGKELAFTRGASDIKQYEGMIGGHAHGLTKDMIWGLWEAAMYDGFGGEKVMAFLDQANNTCTPLAEC